jgi:hypothetical protein
MGSGMTFLASRIDENQCLLLFLITVFRIEPADTAIALAISQLVSDKLLQQQ